MYAVKICLTLLAGFFLSQTALAKWEKLDSGTLSWLHSIYFLNEKQGWIVGGNGTLLSTTDGGSHWDKKRMLTTDAFRDVHFTDAQNGWILCERGIYESGRKSPSYLLYSSDGGKGWQSYEFTRDGTERLTRLFFDVKGIGYGIGEGGIILRMEKDRKSWKEIPLPVKFLMLDGAFTSESDGLLVGGGGTVLTTWNGGSTWTDSNVFAGKFSTRLNAIDFADQRRGWAVGDQGEIYFTADGGKAWSEQGSGVNVDLLDVTFQNSEVGFASGDRGVILRTVTGGKSWLREETGSRDRLERLFFTKSRGFAVGYGGAILATGIGPANN